MRLKLTDEIFAIGGVILGFQRAMRIRRKWIRFLFAGVCIASLIAVFLPADVKTKTVDKSPAGRNRYGPRRELKHLASEPEAGSLISVGDVENTVFGGKTIYQATFTASPVLIEEARKFPNYGAAEEEGQLTPLLPEGYKLTFQTYEQDV